MSLRFRGGERLQRGRGIGGLLRLAKGLFSPLAKTIKGVVTSNTGKAIGKAVKNQLVESGASIAGDVMMGNDIRESMQREVKNARQNAAIGIQKRKKRRGPSKFERFCSSESDYSKFKGLCILKYARDYAMGHDDLVEKVQKYFKNSYCKELAIEMVKKTTEAFEKKYGKNDSRSNMNFL